MKTFQARFVVYGRGADADGFLFWRDVRTVAPGEREQFLPGYFADVSGGCVFLFDRRVWNSMEHTIFDPNHVRCEVDSIGYALGMLQEVALRLPEPGEHIVPSAEMLSVRLTHVAPDLITIAGLNVQGEIRFPVETVSLTRFAGQLRSATRSFTRVARAELRRRLAALPREQRPSAEQQNRELINQFTAVADRLGDLTKGQAAQNPQDHVAE